MTLEQIAKALADRRLAVVASATGLTRETLRRIRDGNAKRPAHDTVRKLSDYLEGKPKPTPDAGEYDWNARYEAAWLPEVKG